MTKIISVAAFIFLILSCSSTTSRMSAHEILPRRGYVFVRKIVNLQKISTNVSVAGEIISVGSGFVVKTTHKGAFIMTAAHVCSTNQNNLLPDVKAKDTIKIETLDGRWYSIIVLKVDHDIDACLMFAEDLVDQVKEVKLSDNPPKEGDKVYNIASPYGIHYKNIVPIFEGRYFGSTGFKSFYSFEAAPGSSGSMIVDAEGKLIGLLHSVYRDMYTVVVGVEYHALIQFIKNGLIEHSASHLKEFEEYEIYSNHGHKL